MSENFKIEYPDKKTYWVFWTDKETKFVYGWIESTQVVETNQPNYWTTTDEDEWVTKLETEFNTNPFPPEVTFPSNPG